MKRTLVCLVLLGCGDGDGATSVETSFATQVTQNPFAAGSAIATQHGDTGASDTTPLPGPGTDNVITAKLELGAVCPSIFPLSANVGVAVCTKFLNQSPSVFTFDASALRVLDQHELSKGSLFGGVYPYLDERQRLVAVDGANTLLRFSVDAQGALTVVQSTALAPSLNADCAESCDSVVGLAPDYQGRDWFASGHGQIGTVTRDGKIATFALPAGERVENSLATAPEGTAIVSDRALYLFTADASGVPVVRMRAEYDRGTARKPGQLSWGSGSTPTFFGPITGSEYVAITDNARPTMNLLVYRSDGSSAPVCRFAVPSPAGDGSENSPIGVGRSVFVSSTFGYQYPALPVEAGESAPASAPFVGGMARIDVAPDEASCTLVWTNAVRSAAVPKLSIADGLIYTVERDGADASWYTAIDPRTGSVRAHQQLDIINDTMMLAGTVGPGRTLFQGTFGAIVRITPAP